MFFTKSKKKSKAAQQKTTPVFDFDNKPHFEKITQNTAAEFGLSAPIASHALISNEEQLRTREELYSTWNKMMKEPLVFTCLKLIATAALGGHETSGQLAFIEPSEATRKNKELAKQVDEMSERISPLVSDELTSRAITALGMGDSYSRVFGEKNHGVHSIYSEELVRPEIIQPYEVLGRNVGYAVYTGEKGFEKLDLLQMARCKMRRDQYIPQVSSLEKMLRTAITEDDPAKQPIIPSSVGGSLLYTAESPFKDFQTTLVGMNSNRLVDSIREVIVSPNVSGMSEEQQRQYINNFLDMLLRSHKIAKESINEGKAVAGHVYHAMPRFDDKQSVDDIKLLNPPRNSTISIEDVLVNARRLAGAFGLDISLTGWANEMSGGLGEGGFFRTSVQVAEMARSTRQGLSDFVDQIANIDFYHKHGQLFDKSNKPWRVNFYGSISAQKAEEQETKLTAMTSGMTLLQVMQGLKELDANKNEIQLFLSKTMLIDETLAESYAEMLVNGDFEGRTGESL